MKPVIVLELSEANVVKLMLDFLQEKELFLSQLSLEKESGVSSFAHFSDDAIFLRDLITAGSWDDVADFLQPLFEIPEFPKDICTYIILKGKFLELLSLKAEIISLKPKCDEDFSDIVNCLKLIEPVCPSKEEFRDLCFLLNLRNLGESPQYAKCTPHSLRIKCFNDLLQIVEPFLQNCRPIDSLKAPAASRLKNLLIKGILYETCVDLCTQRALANDSQASERVVADVSNRCLLNGPELSDADAGLVSWLESLPNDVYLLPFEQRSLELRFHSLDSQVSPVKPSWAEYVVSQNQVEKSRLISLAATAHLQLKSSSDNLRGSPEHLPTPSKTVREPPMRAASLTPQSSFSQSLVSAYTNAKLGGGSEQQPVQTQMKSSKPGGREDGGFTSGIALQHAPSPIPEAKTEVVVTPVSGGKSPVDPKLGSATQNAPPVDVHQRPARSNYQDMGKPTATAEVMSNATSLSSSRYTSGTTTSNIGGDQNGNRPPVSSQGQVPAAASSFVGRIGNSSATQGRTRSTSPPPRIRSSIPDDSSAGTVTETVKSLLQFTPVTVLEDSQPVRAVAIHPPSGKFYAVGSNSRNLRICYYPDISRPDFDYSSSSRDSFNNVPVPAKLVLQIQKYHRGSIFCLAWNSRGDLLASGSNDKSVKLIHFDAHHQTVGAECEFTHHDATVRDLSFFGDNDVLVSAGQGDCRIYLTDCPSQRVVRALAGHTDHIFSVCALPGNTSTLVSGSRDRTIRLWDVSVANNAPLFVIDTPAPVNAIHCSAILSSSDPRPASGASSFLLACGLANGVCQLRDLRVPSRILAEWQPHNEEIRSVHLHPSLPFILSGSYDSTVALTTLSSQGGVIDLQHISNTHKVGVHLDKVVKCCWHSNASAPLSFLSASADKTVVCWVQQQHQPLQKSTTSHIPTYSGSAASQRRN